MEALQLLTPFLALDSTGLSEGLRDFFLPLIVLAVSLIAVGFLARSQAVGLAGFLVVAILVLAVVADPSLLLDTASWVAERLGGSGTTSV